MIMNNWKFLINRLIFLLGMIGSFMSATFGYSEFIINSISLDVFIIAITIEHIGIVTIFLILINVIIDFIKDNKKGRNDGNLS